MHRRFVAVATALAAVAVVALGASAASPARLGPGDGSAKPSPAPTPISCRFDAVKLTLWSTGERSGVENVLLGFYTAQGTCLTGVLRRQAASSDGFAVVLTGTCPSARSPVAGLGAAGIALAGPGIRIGKQLFPGGNHSWLWFGAGLGMKGPTPYEFPSHTAAMRVNGVLSASTIGGSKPKTTNALYGAAALQLARASCPSGDRPSISTGQLDAAFVPMPIRTN